MIEWKMITFHLFITFITLTTSFIHYQLFKYKFHHNIKYLQVLDENSAVKNAESLFIAPTLAVPAEEFNRLRKSLPRQTVSSVISKSKMISYVNGTPFCLCVDYLSGSNFCIMAKPGETGFIMEPFLTWIRYFLKVLLMLSVLAY
jgi:hypothetical protein